MSPGEWQKKPSSLTITEKLATSQYRFLCSCIFAVTQCSDRICASATWAVNGVTVVGGNGNGSQLNQVNPNYLHVDYGDDSIFVTDWWFDRVVKWEKGASVGRVVAGGRGRGNRSDQLGGPVGIFVEVDETLIICDGQNRRVQRVRKDASSGETVLNDTSCRGVALDSEGSLYVVDWALYRVMKYGVSVAEIVVGGNGQGANLNQLNNPIGLFLDQNRVLYVVDRSNHWVTKWEPGAKEGITVAGGNGRGAGLNQLDSPTGVFVDTFGTVYVSDRLNHRIMRWPKSATSGTIIAGGNGAGEGAHQLNGGFDLTFDRHGNLYVSDDGNFRVQTFMCKGKLFPETLICIALSFRSRRRISGCSNLRRLGFFAVRLRFSSSSHVFSLRAFLLRILIEYIVILYPYLASIHDYDGSTSFYSYPSLFHLHSIQ